MANRYWVLAIAGSWNGTNTLKWSTTSGGAPGAAEPTAADDVFFDGNSGANTVTLDTMTGECRSLNFTGYTGTFSIAATLQVGDGTAGAFTLSSGMTFTADLIGRSIIFLSTVSGNNITSNGITVPCRMTFSGTGGVWTFQDAMTISNRIYITLGELNTNGKTVTTRAFQIDNDATATLTLGASNLILTTDDSVIPQVVFNVSGTSANISAASSTITFTDVGTGVKTFAGAGKIYGTLSITSGGTGRVLITGSNTFANLPQITGVSTKSLRFTAGTTQTFTGGTNFGNGANLITIDTETGGSAATLSMASGTVQVTSISLKDSAAAGGAAWKAPSNSGNIDVSGNSGWVFTPVAIGGGAGVQQNALLLGVG